MSLLSSLSALGYAKETTPGTFVTATGYIPFMSPKDEDVIATLRDEAMRANDTNLQGAYPGPAHLTFGVDTYAYPITTGLLLKMLGLADTATAGPTSTTLSAATTAGSNAVAGTVALTAGQIITIPATGSGTTYVPAESRYTTSATTVHAPWNYVHPSGTAVNYAAAKHVFKAATFPQPQPSSYSLTDYKVAETRGYPGCKLEQLDINIDGSGDVTLSPSWQGFPSIPLATPTITQSELEPLLGWQAVANLGVLGAGVRTEYESIKYTFKRPLTVIAGSNGSQAPREVFAADLDVTASAKVVFEDSTHFDMFRNWVQTNAFSVVLASPRTGNGLRINLSQPSIESAKADRGSNAIMADISYNGVFNTPDGGAASVEVFNGQTAAY